MTAQEAETTQPTEDSDSDEVREALAEAAENEALDALDPETAAAIIADQVPVRRVRREAPPIPEIPGVAPEQVIKALAAVWKAATDRETPTFRQMLEEGVVRVDVDAPAGYLSVATDTDSHRAIGVRRDMVAPLVAAFTARTVRNVEQLLGKGPAKISTIER